MSLHRHLAPFVSTLLLVCASVATAQVDLTQGHYRWRNDDGPEGSGTPPLQATSSADDTTASTTDVVVSGMSLTPGAGDYLVWFSGSIENSTGTENQFVSLYLDGLQVAHTERRATTDGSIPMTPFPVATHALIAGVTAGQTIDVRWRTTAGTATMHERTLVVAPVNPADVTEVSATADDFTTSITDVAVAGMSITPGAGDYLVWFSGSVENDTAGNNQFVSIYQNGVQVAHSERQNFTEGSILGTSFPVATHAFLPGVGAAEPVDIRWRTEGGTATMHERTLVVAKVNAADIFQASDTADTATASGTDVVVPSLTLTPGAADYLAWFSGSIEGDTGSTSQFASLYDNGAQLAHSERRILTESSIPATSFPVASHAYIPGLGPLENVDVRWRTTGGNATMHERTLVLQKLASTSASWAAPEDTKLFALTKTTPKRVRFAISNQGVIGSGAVAYELQVAETATCSTGAYSTVPMTATGHWQIIDSTFVTDGEATNNLPAGLTDDATTFVSGELKDAGNTTGAITLAKDEFTEIEFAVEATTNATDGGDYCFRLYDATNNQVLDTYTAYAEVQLAIPGGTLTLADHDAGQVPDRFTSPPSATDVLFRFKLSQTPPVTITDIRVQYTTGGGVVDGDVAAGALYRDENGDGIVDGGDTPLQTGVAGTGGQLAFTSLTEDPGSGTNYLVVATVDNLVSGDTTTFSLGAADIDQFEVGVSETGAVTNAVHTVDPARAVYYSVGTSAADLKNGSPTVNISSGIAIFSTSQPANVGAGDEITYNGGTKAYISGRMSSTVYSVTTATGLVPPDIAGATVNSITRAFNSLSAAHVGSGDLNHLNTTDLVAGNLQLHWACYDDAPMPDTVYVSGWTTGVDNYIRIFTPVNLSEVGVSQRHTGTAGTGFRLAPVDASVQAYQIIRVGTENVRIEGLEIDGSGLTNAQAATGIHLDIGLSNAGDFRLDGSIIHDLHTTQGGRNFDGSFGVYAHPETANAGPPLRLTNNIVYDISANIPEDNHHVGGFHIGSRTTSLVYNNTIFRIRNTGPTPGGAAWGIEVDAWPSGTGTATVEAKNNFVGDVLSDNDTEGCYEANNNGVLNQGNNVSSDATASGVGSATGQTSYAAYFQSITDGSEDLHLTADSATLWGVSGEDLSATFDRDIDRGLRVSPWDIGADEFGVAASVVTLSSNNNQSFVVGSFPMTAATITIVEGTSGGNITDTGDIRIRIPAGFNMRWDTSVVTVTLSGLAASKVDTTVEAYEDGDRTVVLEVTSNFFPGDDLVVDGLAFASFTAPSPLDNLELEVFNDGVVSTLDDKTIAIIPGGNPIISSDSDQVFTDGDPSTLASPISVTDAATPVIAPGNDIGIVIPAGLDVTWDGGFLTPTFGGPAAPKVDPNVSYAGGDKVLLITVNTAFAAGDYLLISDVYFASFVGPSAGSLELELGTVFADSDDKTITVLTTGAVEVFTATSTSTKNHLAWVNPADPSYVHTRILARDDGVFPTDPLDLVTARLVVDHVGTMGQKESFDDTGLTDDDTYHYTAFVYDGTSYSKGVPTHGRPFDHLSGDVRWAYSTGATTMAPPALRFESPSRTFVYAVSNDSILHSMDGSGSPAPGEWPSSWKPYRLGGIAQARPLVVPFPVGVGAPNGAVFVGSEDGTVYAVNAETGAAEWQSAAVGDMLLASPAGIFSDYGAPYHYLVVGTRNSTPPNFFKGLDPDTGSIDWTFDNSALQGGDGSLVGIVSGGGSVRYKDPGDGSRHFYFASRSAGSPDTVWCVKWDGSAVQLVWSSDLPGTLGSPDIDGSPMPHNLYAGRIYVGTNQGEVVALDAATGNVEWTYDTADGAVKGFVFPQFGTTNLIFSTTNKVWSLSDDGASPSLNPNWPATFLSLPSTPLYVPGTTHVLVGSSDGRLYQLDVGDPSLFVAEKLGDGGGGVGMATVDVFNSMIYVGTEGGVVYAVDYPILP